MPSSTSSSDRPAGGTHGDVRGGAALMRPGMPGDDPSVADGPVERPLPAKPLGIAGLLALVVAGVLLGGWELHWRGQGVEPSHTNSDGQWAIQRRRIDEGEGDATVLIGTSRMLFDVRLDVWERLAGRRPIQLALEGTSPLPVLEDLADDPDFTGTLLVDATPDLFFSGYAMRGKVLERYRSETLSQRMGEHLAMGVEPHLAFLDPDFALFRVVERQAWPRRDGVPRFTDVRKLSVHEADRNTRMWARVENDPDYREQAKAIWAQFFDAPPPPPMATPEKAAAVVEDQIARASRAVAKLRARGVRVVLVRPPSDGRYLEFENRTMPRARTWDVLVARAGVPGIHFEDHADMRGLDLPEWSHLSAADAVRYTEALYRASASHLYGDAPGEALVAVRSRDR